MAAVLIQAPTNAGSAATLNSFLTAPKLNSILVAFIYANVTDSTTITMAGWTAINNVGSSLVSLRAFWRKVDGSADLTTVSSAATGASLMSAAILEYSGLMSSPVDQSATNSASSASTAPSGTINTVEPTDLLLCGFCYAGSVQNVAFDSSFVKRAGIDNDKLFAGSRSVTAVGSYSLTATWSTSRASRNILVGLKVAGGRSFDSGHRPALFKPGNAR